MAKVDVKVTTTNYLGKKSTKTITDVNPEASSAQIKSFVRGLVALTTNTYDSASRVETINIDTESTKPAPTFTFGNWRKGGSYYTNTCTYNGDGEVIVTAVSPNDKPYTAAYYDSDVAVMQYATDTQSSQVNVTVYTAETANFRAATFTSTFTWA